MKAIIYTRVSSDEQVKGTSLDHQEEICRKYCKEKGFEVLELFREEGASAKSTNREVFLRSIEYCRKNKGQVGVFVVAKVDRFARNTEDHFMIRKRLLDYGTTLHSVTEPIGNSPTEKFFETILAGAADFDNAIRKQRCGDGMYARIKSGIYPWQPPIGYKCLNFKKQGLKKTGPDDPHPTTFPIIQVGLQEFATGMYNKTSLAKRLDVLGLEKERGMKTYSQFMDTLLTEHRLKFYAGWLFDPRESIYIRGLHKPIITDEDVYKILLVLSGKKRSIVHNRHNPLFPLRGWAICYACSKKMTGSSSTGERGVKYPYYHCSNKQCLMRGKGIKKSELEEAFVMELAKITPRKEWLDMFKATVVDLWKEQGTSLASEVDVYGRKLKMLEEKRKRIFELREEGSYSKEEFQERREMNDDEIMATKISLSEAKIEQFDIDLAITYATEFISDLGKQWFNVPPQLQPKFQKLVFPDGFSYSKTTGIRTPKIGYIYELNQANVPDKTILVVLF